MVMMHQSTKFQQKLDNATHFPVHFERKRGKIVAPLHRILKNGAAELRQILWGHRPIIAVSRIFTSYFALFHRMSAECRPPLSAKTDLSCSTVFLR